MRLIYMLVMKDIEAELDFLKVRINTLETHIEELKQYYFNTRKLDGIILKHHTRRLDKLDNGEF